LIGVQGVGAGAGVRGADSLDYPGRRNALVSNDKRVLATALVAVLCIASALSFAAFRPARAAAPKSAAWQENITMLISVDGKPDGRAHMYDSEDFQRMLLVFDDLKLAVVLDLPETMVYSLPPDSVHTSQDGTASVDETLETYLTGLERKDALISFDISEHAVTLQPLPPLVGPTTLARILELKPAYALAAQTYKPDPAKVAVLKAVAPDTEVRVYFGTWCFMCKKLVPPLIRTIGMAGNPKIQIHYIGVDEDLKEPAADLKRNRITKTPTIIVLRGGREIGRVEEKPETTIEGDLAKIFMQN